MHRFTIDMDHAMRKALQRVEQRQPQPAGSLRGSEANARSYEARLSDLLADPAGLTEDAAMRQRLNVQLEETRATTRNGITRLNLQAPFAGRWLNLNPDWQPGQWIGRQEPLGILVDPRSWQVDAYVAPGQIHHIAVNDPVRFYPEGQTAPLSDRVLAIGSTRTGQQAHRMLCSHFGGPVQVTAQDPMVPSAALCQVLVFNGGIRFPQPNLSGSSPEPSQTTRA